MRYRMLGPDEKPDCRKGDEFCYEYESAWLTTKHTGKYISTEKGIKYRRPVDENGKDLK